MVVVVLLAAIPILLSKLLPLKITLLMVSARLRANTTVIALLRVRRVLLLLLRAAATGGIVVVVVAPAAPISAVASAPRRPQEVLVLHVVLVIPVV
jgi:hypothetical protein